MRIASVVATASASCSPTCRPAACGATHAPAHARAASRQLRLDRRAVRPCQPRTRTTFCQPEPGGAAGMPSTRELPRAPARLDPARPARGTAGPRRLSPAALVALPYMLGQRRWRELLGHGALAVPAARCSSACPALAACAGSGLPGVLRHEHIRRFAGDAQHSSPVVVLPAVAGDRLFALERPVMSALRQAWHERRQAPVVFLAPWLSLPPGVLQPGAALPTYIMPRLLPLALLMGHALRSGCAWEQPSCAATGRQPWPACAGGSGLPATGAPVYQEEPSSCSLVLARSAP
ncbi:hypothetical protein ACPA9J_16560 [Pseudomonas aeruginosa]